MKTVRPYQWYGAINVSWNLNIFTGPTINVVCGDCRCHFSYTIPVGINYPRTPCPHCKTINIMPFTLE